MDGEAARPPGPDPSQLLKVLMAFRNGDFSVRMPSDQTGIDGKIADTLNEILDLKSALLAEIGRVAHAVGKEGQVDQRVHLPRGAGGWATAIDAVNGLIQDLMAPLRDMARVIEAVARGDLNWKVWTDGGGNPPKGEFLRTGRLVNDMVTQLKCFASEVSRVTREVGTEGKLGGQADPRGVAGTWKDLVGDVNSMAGNLTSQVRNISEVATAIAMGDLSRKITVEARNEFLELKNTINTMVDQLNAFASEVTRVARAVGTEGNLGGQAFVRGVAGTWKDLTENVNHLAGNLTAQVRAIAEVARAVAAGDLSRSISVQAAGEVALLKDDLNAMIRNLREATVRAQEQDWLKTNLARLTRMLQGQRDLQAVVDQVLPELAPLVGAHHGVFYLAEGEGEERVLHLLGSYAFQARKSVCNQFRLGQGLVGQAALEKKRILITEVPADYVQLESGLGRSVPLDLVVLPVLFEGQVLAVVELASLNRFSPVHLAFLELLSESIGISLNTISATMRQEELLMESQTLAEELQDQQKDLQRINQELEERTYLVSAQKAEVEAARAAIQEKAEQLTLASRYKSEFLANMSHDLRTPLNSMLILARALEENAEANLTPRQVEYAATIHAAGLDLLELLNDVLDLSKIESRTSELERTPVPFRDLVQFAERTFRPVAERKRLRFETCLDPCLPPSVSTDSRRLRQVIRNLLANAFKFTERGLVTFSVAPVCCGWSRAHPALDRASRVVAFTVKDTGIGIPAEQREAIFEAFHQADGNTSRKFGGTGLGLSISRGIANLLGGEIQLQSEVGKGSAFTLYLPADEAAGPGEAAAGDMGREPAREEGPVFFMEEQEGVSRTRQPLTREAVAAVLNRIQTLTHRYPRRLLLVEDDRAEVLALKELLEGPGVETVVARDGREALEAIRSRPFDCMVLDLNLPDMTGLELLKRLRADGAAQAPQAFPVIVHTARELTRREEMELRRRAETIVVKDPGSPERVFDETALFLDRAEAPVPRGKRRRREGRGRPLEGRRILLVDDDARNVFALREMLERQGVSVQAAGTRAGSPPAAGGPPGGGPRPHGHHAARDGRLRGHPGRPAPGGMPGGPHHRPDRQGHEGGPGAVPGGRGLGLPHQAGGHRPAPGGDPGPAGRRGGAAVKAREIRARRPEPTPLPYAFGARKITPLPYASGVRKITPLPYASGVRKITPLPYASGVRKITPLPYASGVRKITPAFRATSSGSKCWRYHPRVWRNAS
jgi:signal transduction histidine kinase/HAMP domain-containing protein/DNA-binding response OmpR family regulator